MTIEENRRRSTDGDVGSEGVGSSAGEPKKIYIKNGRK